MNTIDKNYGFIFSAAPGFLFQPYRKPKRIRTAFSPSQLLQLEKAFEKSHYVVGQERKDLASELQLTETQVIDDACAPTTEDYRTHQVPDSATNFNFGENL